MRQGSLLGGPSAQHQHLSLCDAPREMPAALQGQSPAPLGTKPSSLPSPCSVLRVLAGAVLPADPRHAAEDTGDAQVRALCPLHHPCHVPVLVPQPSIGFSPPQEQPEGAVPRGCARCLLQSPHPPPIPTSHRLLDELCQLPDSFCLPGYVFLGGLWVGRWRQTPFPRGNFIFKRLQSPFLAPFRKTLGLLFIYSLNTICPSAERTKWWEKRGAWRGGGMEGSESRLGSSPDSLIREAVAASHAKACLSPSAAAVASQSLCHGM